MDYQLDGVPLSLSVNLEATTTSIVGRTEEINQLEEAYRRCLQRKEELVTDANDTVSDRLERQEIVLISGRSGSGKTALANTIVPVVLQDSGFFLSGKFELSGSKEPYAVFVSAISKFILGLVEDTSTSSQATASSIQQQQRCSQICAAAQKAVGNDGKVLTDLIPSLERLIGPQLETCKMLGNEGLHRFHRVFSRFCRSIASIVPVVLFLDDLQWANQASLALLQSLLEPIPSEEPTTLLVIASYRSEEVDLNHNLTIGKADKQQQSRPFQDSPFSNHLRLHWMNEKLPEWLNITNIELSNLNESSVTELISAKLSPISVANCLSLGALVHLQSKGNVFYALQYLRMLVDRGKVYRDAQTQEIVWDNVDYIMGTGTPTFIPNSVDDVVCQKLRSLPTFHLEMLQVAACLGDEFEACKLGLLLDGHTEDVVSALDMAVSQGLLDHEVDEGLYRFNHDRIRQATLSTANNEDDLSFQVGTKLWKRLSPISLRASIHVVVSLLDKGIDRIHDQTTRYSIAALNLEAGLDAASQAAFIDAAQYLDKGMILLKTGDYWNDRYELSLRLFNALADAQVCNQSFDKVKELTDEVFVHAKNHKDKMGCYVARINAIGQNGSVLEALNFGIEVLQLIGEPLPPVPSNGVILAEKFKTMIAIRARSNEAILSIPPMTDENKMAVIHILDILIPYAFQSSPPYANLIGMKIVRLCLKHGLTKRGAVGFVTFAWFLSRVDRKSGYGIGQLALSLVANTRAREMIPRVHLSFYFLTSHWTRPIKESLAPLKDTSRIGMEIGDIEYSMYSSYFHCTHALYAGVNLPQVETYALETTNTMKRYKQENALQMASPTLYYTQHMMGRPNATLLWENVRDTDNKASLLNHLSFGAEVAYMFGDFIKAQRLSSERLGLNFTHFAMYGHAMNTFYDGLIAVALAQQGERNLKGNLKIARNKLKRLHIWAKHCPENFLNKHKLLLAEIRSLNSRVVVPSTHRLYGESFELASKHGFTQEAALACEKAGDYMHRHKEEGLAATYWAKAFSLYTEWGGTTKADHLRSLIESRLKKPFLHAQ